MVNCNFCDSHVHDLLLKGYGTGSKVPERPLLFMPLFFHALRVVQRHLEDGI